MTLPLVLASALAVTAPDGTAVWKGLTFPLIER